MRHAAFVLFTATLLCAPAIAQDAGLGTPVITPPILSQPAAGQQQLLVPPTAASPAPLASPSGSTPPPATTGQSQAAPAEPVAPAAPAAPEAAPAVERTSTSESFTDWTLECFEPAFESGACQITHRVTAGNAQQVVMVFALSAASADGDAAIQIALPLGISLPAGVQLAIGDGYQNHIALERCTPQGCIVEGTGSRELLAAMKRGASGTLVVQNEQGRPIQLPFSLNGFTAAFTAMTERG